MADYPTSKLDKALAHRGFSSTTKPSWREKITRHDTIPASKAIQAPDVISGFAGSWAAQFHVEEGVRSETVGEGPAPLQRRINRLGQPGMAEINFRPYDVDTGRQGGYGPSLLGHPISFSIIGPTLRHPLCDHQWRLDTTGVQDRLTIDDITVLSSPASPVSLPATRDTIPDIYGFDAVSFPEEGVYIVVSATGSGGRLDNGLGGSTAGGLGDTQIGLDAGPGPGGKQRTAITPHSEESKFEIFRVVGLGQSVQPNDTLLLDSGKRISDFFTVPDEATLTPIVRAIMMFRPAATRMVAVPGSRVGNSGSLGQETVFAFVPPEEALNSDFQPPVYEWTTGGAFDPWTGYAALNAVTGNSNFFNQQQALPNPTPTLQGEVRVQGSAEVPIITEFGATVVYAEAGTEFDAANDIGKIIRLRSVRRETDGELALPATLGGSVTTAPGVERMLGYWEIIDTHPLAGGGGTLNGWEIRRVAQFDPDTGQPFYGHPEFFSLEPPASTENIWFDFTLHESIAAFHRKSYIHPAELDSVRLDMLIDPAWAQPSVKGRRTAIGHQGRPDKAIFDTASSSTGADGANANPGSMLDLGFRVVFFPAKIGASNEIVPDFDRPIEANEVLLDPSKSGEKQWLEIDYAAGLVYLSHAAQAGAGCQLCPDVNILTHADNPRGEMVFFASCVPFSREAGQRGSAPRITGGVLHNRDGNFCDIDNVDHADIYGARKMWGLAAGQIINSGSRETIKLNVQLDPLDLPPAGFVDLVQGDLNPAGGGILNQRRRVSTWGYTRVTYSDGGNGGNTTLQGCFGGGETGVATVSPTAADPWSAILRRSVEMPNTLDGRHGTDFQYDTTFGDSKRASVLRFRHADLQHERDGSVTVEMTDPRVAAHEKLFDELFSSWVIRGGGLTTSLPGANAGVLDFAEVTVLIEGVRSVLPAQSFQVGLGMGPPVDAIVYIDGTDPNCPVFAYTTDLPLPSSSDVLLGSYTHDGADVLTYTDLRQPLVDVDKRLDVTVGAYAGHQQPSEAHFNELADAIEFVAETAHRRDGQFRRIKIVGPTTENPLKLPIAPQINGLIIEGAQHDGEPAGSSEPEISFRGNVGSLFDLGGCEGWILRDVTFRYDNDGQPADISIGNRNLFLVSSGTLAKNMVFENIRLNGPAHGVLYVAGGGAGTGISRAVFRNVIAPDLTDFGIYIHSSADTDQDILIDHCAFTVRKSTAIPGPEIAGLAGTNYGILHFDGSDGAGIVIRDTDVIGGDVGIRAGGTGPYRILGCKVQDTDNAGIYLDANNIAIENCNLRLVYSLAGGTGLSTVKVGIYQNAAANEVSISHTEISVSGGVAGTDYSIEFSGTSQSNRIVNNNVTLDINAGEEAWVIDNVLSAGRIAAGASCVIGGNRLLDAATGDIVNGHDCNVYGNIIEGNLLSTAGNDSRYSNNWFKGDGTHFTSAGNLFNNCTFGDPNDVTPAGLVRPLGSARFVGCWFGNGFTTTGAVDDVLFEGCHVYSSVAMSVTGDDWVFTGCVFEGTAANLSLDIDGVRTAIRSCSFDDRNWSVYLHDTGAAAQQQYVVSNNVIREPVGTGGGVRVDGSYCVLEGNIIGGRYDVGSNSIVYTGDYSLITSNVMGNWISVTGSHNTINGNQTELGASINDGGGAGENVFVNNVVVTDLTAAAQNSQYNNNNIAGTATLSGANADFSHNKVREFAQTGLDCSVVGNHFQNSFPLLLNGDGLLFRDNTVDGETTWGNGIPARQEFTGNSFTGAVSLTDNRQLVDGVISGNSFLSTVDLNCTAGIDDITITANRFEGTVDLTSANRTTFTGNRCAATVTANNCNQCVFSGNWIGTTAGANADLNLGSSDDYLVIGNYVTGNILVFAGAGTALCGIIVGNRAELIGDGVGGAAPANYQVTMGNKVDNGSTVFNVSPGTASLNSNIEDN